MFTLEENYEGDRSLCVECFPEFRYKVTTIKEAEKLWMIHQSQVYNSQSAFINQREQKLQQIKDIYDNYQQVYQNKQDELLKLIDNKNKQIEKEISKLHLSKNSHSLLSLELKDLQNVLNQLSQKDQMSQIKVVQMKLRNEDQKFHKDMFFKLSEIEQLQKDSKQVQLKLFDSNDYFLQDIQTQLERFSQEIQNSEQDSSVFTNLMPKFQNELFQTLLVLMKGIRDKGNQYMTELNNGDSKIKNKEQEQMNIFKYNEALKEFDKKFRIIENQIQLKDEAIPTENNLEADFQIINVEPQILLETNLTVNSLNKLQILYSRPFDVNLQRFSQSLKHSDITINTDGKIVQSTQGGYYLCLFDQPIPNYGSVVVDFKIKQIQNMFAGICLRESINDDFEASYGISKGCYLMYYSGHVYSHHNEQKNNKKLGFDYSQDDIISMEVNVQQKQITWRNKAKGQACTLEIETTSDLYFCFNLYGQNQIELV